MIRNGFHQNPKPLRGAMIDPTHPLSQGLFAALLFNEGTGSTVFDASGNGSHVTGVASPPWAAGQHGSAGSLNGSNQYYTNTTANFPTAAVTIVLIANTVNQPGSIFGSPVADVDGGIGAINIHYPYGGIVYWQFGANRIQYTPPASFFGTWRHAAFTSGGGGQGIYIDGIRQAAGVNTPRTMISPGFAVGVWNSLLNLCQIEQVLVYKRVLSGAEIAWLNEDNYAFMAPPNVRRFAGIPAVVGGGASVQGGLSIGARRLSIGI